MVTHSNGVWSIPIAITHKPYTTVQLKRGHGEKLGYRVVIVDIEKFMQCFAREMPCYFVPPVGEWREEKVKALCKHLDPATGIPEMPVVGFATRRKWFGLIGTVGVVSFENGRHRSRYLEHAGAKCMPVEIRDDGAATLLTYCGCSCCN